MVNVNLAMSSSQQAVLAGILQSDFDDQAFVILRAAVLQRMQSAAARQLLQQSSFAAKGISDVKSIELDTYWCTWNLLGVVPLLS